MNLDLIPVLCCPECRHDLVLAGCRPAGRARVLEGTLRCAGCDAEYPIRRGVPRFVASDGDVGSFSYEWTRWKRVQLDVENGTDESEVTLRQKTGFTRQDLEGRLVLDVGCGAGRFLDVVSRWGARAVGVDLSFAVDAALENLGTRPNVDIVQADIFRLPFKTASFDAIFSVGVLHHTRDTRQAFLALPPLLREGGEVAVWLYFYPDRLYCVASDVWRLLVRPLPHRALYGFCRFLVGTLSEFYRRPVMSRWPWRALRRVLPVNTHPDVEWRVLDTFDWYSPRYQDKACSAPRVIRWFQEAGLTDFEVLDYPTSVRGRRRALAPMRYRVPPIDVRSRRLLVFGAGAGGDEAFDLLAAHGLLQSVAAVCDNDPAKQGRTFHGHAIQRFDEVPRDSYDIALIASLPGREAISAQLETAGLIERRDFATVQYIAHSAMPLVAGSRV